MDAEEYNLQLIPLMQKVKDRLRSIQKSFTPDNELDDILTALSDGWVGNPEDKRFDLRDLLPELRNMTDQILETGRFPPGNGNDPFPAIRFLQRTEMGLETFRAHLRAKLEDEGYQPVNMLGEYNVPDDDERLFQMNELQLSARFAHSMVVSVHDALDKVRKLNAYAAQ